MDDALPVGRVECFGNLPRHLNGFVERQRSPGDALLKRLALDDLENQETVPIDGFETMNRRDVGMIQRREQSRFPLQPRHPFFVIRERCRQHFDGHFALELAIPRTIDLTHATYAEAEANPDRAESERYACITSRSSGRSS